MIVIHNSVASNISLFHKAFRFVSVSNWFHTLRVGIISSPPSFVVLLISFATKKKKNNATQRIINCWHSGWQIRFIELCEFLIEMFKRAFIAFRVEVFYICCIFGFPLQYGLLRGFLFILIHEIWICKYLYMQDIFM